jgi:DNA primase
MDVIALHQAGFTNAVASLGTAFTSGHASLIKRYVNEVYLTFDSDGAGTKAALRALPILKEAGITAKIIRMDPYKDPDEFIKNLGAEAFEERINKARNGFLFSLEVLERDYDMNSPEGKTSFFNEAAKRLTEFEEEIERNNYIEAVAEKYHISIESLRKLVAKIAIKVGQATPATKPKQAISKERGKEDGNLQSQKILLTWLIDHEQLFKQIKKYISPQDFTKELYRTVAELLFEQYEEGRLVPAKVMNHFTDEEEHREVASLFNARIQQLQTKAEEEKALKETIIRVKSYSIDEATRQLDPTDIMGLQRIMEAKRSLQDLQKLHISID